MSTGKTWAIAAVVMTGIITYGTYQIFQITNDLTGELHETRIRNGKQAAAMRRHYETIIDLRLDLAREKGKGLRVPDSEPYG